MKFAVIVKILHFRKTVGHRRKTSHFDLEIAGFAFDNLCVQGGGNETFLQRLVHKGKAFLERTFL